jgi:hypothetical protein
MSNLSEAETTAGISKRALESLRKNGTNGDSPHPTRAEVISGVRETRIIDEPYRKLSLLETRDGDVILRNVEFVGNKAHLSLVHLEYEQSLTLAKRVLERFHLREEELPKTSRARA